MSTAKPGTRTESEALADLASHIDAAYSDPKAWDVPGLLSDAISPIGKLSRILKETPALINQVREVAIIIRETSSPVSIIAMDLFDRLRRIETALMEWTGESEVAEAQDQKQKS